MRKKKSTHRRILVQAVFAFALLLQSLPVRAQAPTAPVTLPAPTTPALPQATDAAATPEPPIQPNSPQNGAAAGNYTVGQCRDADRETLRNEIQSAALAVVGSSTSALDIDALVDRKWRELNVDAVVDAEVARAVQQLSSDEGYWSRLLSGWSSSKAEEFAQRVSQDAFTSEAFSSTISALSTAIGDEIARQVNAELAAAASTAFLCLRDYVGTTYSANLFRAFEESVRATVVSSDTMALAPGALNIGIVDTHGGLITGAGIIVVTQVGSRVAARISAKLAERVAGKVIGRVLGRAGASFVPVAGWVVGIALIVWDLVEGGKGALPQIQEALTGEDVKVRIRTEVADAVRAGLPEEAAITSLETAVGLLEEWDAFCTRYAAVCTLAEENASFRALLNDLPLADLDKLQTLENVFLRDLGRTALDQALETGDFDRLLLLPPQAATILADTGSVSTTLAWAAVAGPDLALVASVGMHRFAAPVDVTRDRLDKLLAWNDGVAVRQFLLLDVPVREMLWPLSGQTLLDFVTLFDEATVTRFADGLSGWQVGDRQRIASDFLAGARTLAEVAAGPTPLPSFTLQPLPSAAASAHSSAATATQGVGAAATLQVGATQSAPTATASAAKGLFGRTDPVTLGLVGALVLLLAVVAALLLWRRGPRAQ